MSTTRSFASDGLAFGKNGNLFLSSLEDNGVYYMPAGAYGTFTLMVHDQDKMKWPDTIGFDHD